MSLVNYLPPLSSRLIGSQPDSGSPSVWSCGVSVPWLLRVGLSTSNGAGTDRSVVKTPHQVWGLRFTMAIFEASTFSGTHVSITSTMPVRSDHQYILGSWYKDSELGARTAVVRFYLSPCSGSDHSLLPLLKSERSFQV